MAEARPKSVFCLPVVNQAKLVAILYLENNLTTRAFTPARIATLDLLAAQAAISIENATLYTDLEARVDQRTRRPATRRTRSWRAPTCAPTTPARRKAPSWRI